jgi:hypothetical protein
VGEQRERRHVSGGRGAIENGIRQARYRRRRDPRRIGEWEQIEMVWSVPEAVMLRPLTGDGMSEAQPGCSDDIIVISVRKSRMKGR